MSARSAADTIFHVYLSIIRDHFKFGQIPVVCRCTRYKTISVSPQDKSTETKWKQSQVSVKCVSACVCTHSRARPFTRSVLCGAKMLAQGSVYPLFSINYIFSSCICAVICAHPHSNGLFRRAACQVFANVLTNRHNRIGENVRYKCGIHSGWQQQQQITRFSLIGCDETRAQQLATTLIYKNYFCYE